MANFIHFSVLTGNAKSFGHYYVKNFDNAKKVILFYKRSKIKQKK